MQRPKLCPVCNNVALLHSEYESNFIDDNVLQEFQFYLVRCTQCEFTNGDFKKPGDAIKYWNLRSKVKSNNKSKS